MNYRRIPFVGGTPPGEIVTLDGLPSEERTMSKIARIRVSTLPVGIPGLVEWVKYAHPRVYREFAMRLHDADRVHGLGLVALPSASLTAVSQAAAAQPGMAQTIVNTLKDIAATALPLYQQQKLFDLQLKRAANNLAPLDTSTISDISSVKVGIDSNTKNTLLMVAGVGGGILLLSKMLGGRRRR